MRKFPLRGALSRSLAHPTRKCKGYGEGLPRNAPRTKSRGENAEARSTLPQRSNSKTTFHKNADAREQPCKTQRALYAPRAARARAHPLFKKILRGRFGPSLAALERKAQTCPAGSLRAAKRKILYIKPPRGASTPRPRAPERNRNRKKTRRNQSRKPQKLVKIAQHFPFLDGKSLTTSDASRPQPPAPSGEARSAPGNTPEKTPPAPERNAPERNRNRKRKPPKKCERFPY